MGDQGKIFFKIADTASSFRFWLLQVMVTVVVLESVKEQVHGLMSAAAGQRHVVKEKDEKLAPFWQVPVTYGWIVVLLNSQSSEPHCWVKGIPQSNWGSEMLIN